MSELRDRTEVQWAGIQKILGPNTAREAWGRHYLELFALAIEHWAAEPRELARQLSQETQRKCVLGAYDFATGQDRGEGVIPIAVTVLRNASRTISSAVRDA